VLPGRKLFFPALTTDIEITDLSHPLLWMKRENFSSLFSTNFNSYD
jgi:hypothetical protein